MSLNMTLQRGTTVSVIYGAENNSKQYLCPALLKRVHDGNEKELS